MQKIMGTGSRRRQTCIENTPSDRYAEGNEIDRRLVFTGDDVTDDGDVEAK